jgi:hypothetical protein
MFDSILTKKSNTMLKNIVSITGVKTLGKETQKSISGGKQGDPSFPCYCDGVLKAMVDDWKDCQWICSFY